jgi:hypothetical protein
MKIAKKVIKVIKSVKIKKGPKYKNYSMISTLKLKKPLIKKGKT